MNSEILFQEKQRLNYWWLWLIMLGINILTFFALYDQFTQSKSAMHFYDITPLIITLIVTLILFQIRLETKIKKSGIYVRFYPLHLKFKFIAWDELAKCTIRIYNPIGEYLGWGIKGTSKNLAYNISGNIGLQLEFHNGKRLLIGTQKKEELEEVLRGIDINQNNNN